MALQKEQNRVVRENEVYIERIVNAPRRLVFDAWTKAEHLKRWYAPIGATCHFTRIDVRVGGGLHGSIRHADKENWFLATFLEIDPPSKLVFSIRRADAQGNPLNNVEAGMFHEWPEVSTVTLTFEDLGKQTRFVLQQTVDQDLAIRTGAYPSWLQMLDKMEQLITSDDNI